MADSDQEELYCICRKPYDDNVFMIECDICKDWFHGECVSIEEHQAADIDLYHCPECQKTHGPLLLKRRRKRKRLISEDGNPGTIKCGTGGFVKALKQRHFLSSERIVRKLRGHQLDIEYIEKHGFGYPILIRDAAGLDLKVPPSDFTVTDVELAVGSMRELDVIDVAEQSDLKMLMREFVEYYNDPRKDRILNVISLEFSSTKLSDMVTPPRIISELSWVSNYWPDSTGDTRTFIRPEVQKYCLMSVKDSYTDFHIDFGGTSVWYHIIRGSKVFYLIEPTDTNIALYETWTSSAEQNTIFFGDQVKACYKVVVKPGQTLFIPTGWIHSVFTPEDSLVFGGNFVHNYSIKLQLDVYGMERRIETPTKFLFPNLETLYWYAAKNLADMLRGALDGGQEPCKYILDGCKVLTKRLEVWMKAKDQTVFRSHKSNVPEGISHSKLLKEFAQLISQISDKPSPTKSRLSASSTSRFTKIKKKQAPIKVKAKKRQGKPLTVQPVKLRIKSESRNHKDDEEDNDDEIPEQPELRGEKPIITASLTDDSERATMLGLKFKLNRTGAAIKPVTAVDNIDTCTQSEEDSNSGYEDNVVVDDTPEQPAAADIKKYRFSLGGRNINDLTSASEEILSSDNNAPQSPAKSTPPTSHDRHKAWSKGIENLIKATSTNYNQETSQDSNKLMAVAKVSIPGVPRKERHGTKLSRPISTTYTASAPTQSSSAESDSTPSRPGAIKRSASRLAEAEDERMEKRLKKCYTDDTYVYPALQDSDDEDVQPPAKKRNPKFMKDEAWHPKTKTVKHSQPIREKRPSREHAIKPSVKAELEMAKEYLKDKNVSAKRPYIKKPSTQSEGSVSKSRLSCLPGVAAEDEELALTINLAAASMDHGYHLPPPAHLQPARTSVPDKPKIRKTGGSTAKQRLGKLLKIHKMF